MKHLPGGLLNTSMDRFVYMVAVGHDAVMMLQSLGQPDTNNIDVLARARAGDQAAFGELMRAHERQVLRVAFRLTSNNQDAEDVAQEAFLKLHAELRRSPENIDVGRWLYRVTVNLCFDLGRKKKRWTGGLLHEGLTTGEPSPEKVTIDREHQRLIERALQHLTERERAALVLREMEGLTTAEVAEVLGSAEGTVRVQIAAARVKLRKLVGFIRENKT